VSDLSKLKKFLDDAYRVSYLDSHVKGSIAYQIQALRENLGLNQTAFGALVGMPQGVISRLENAENGGVNINTLLKIASGLKVGLAVRFCDFEAILAEDVSPAGLLVANIHQTVSRREAPVTTQVANTTAPTISALPATGSSQAWQIQQIPSSHSAQVFPGSATLSFERYMPTSVLPEYHLST
jgi:transcriptional regulator with XRE-family HTH domain